jgi:hypothetical protein
VGPNVSELIVEAEVVITPEEELSVLSDDVLDDVLEELVAEDEGEEPSLNITATTPHQLHDQEFQRWSRYKLQLMLTA